MTDKGGQSKKIKNPRGTRDLYPAEAARRRWLMERWREVSVRHGFEEVDGPTYEGSELYAVKSGEGILGELFQAFSGKSPEEVERVRESGRAPYALRPEFTPTLARMYAAKANGLPKPCKWFMAGPFFRAERPQRGRLREFLQWNVDVLGLDIPPEKWNAEDAEGRAEVAEAKARMDAECIACCVAALRHLGLSPDDVSVQINDREMAAGMAAAIGVPDARMEHWFVFLDGESKRSDGENAEFLTAGGLSPDLPARLADLVERASSTAAKGGSASEALGIGDDRAANHLALVRQLLECGVSEWCEPFCASVVRGLAYYTGTVFEVIADGERAVAGGGRYDNLVRLFGGPPTPAVGFAMGDVVLSLLLDELDLVPRGDQLMAQVGQTPDVFVLGRDDEARKHLRRVVSLLRQPRVRDVADASLALTRRSSEVAFHARHSYKATKKVDKLLNEAKKSGARFAVIVEDGESCSVKDLARGEQWEGRVPLGDLASRIAARL